MDIMKTKVGEMLNKAKQLNEAQAWLSAFDEKFKQDIINYVQNDQLRKRGVNDQNIVIGTYSYATQRITNGRKKAGDHYTLEDTGAFFRSFEVIIYTDSFEIDADGQKEDTNLFEEYGEGIVGLNEENMDKVREHIRKKYIEYVRRVLLDD